MFTQGALLYPTDITEAERCVDVKRFTAVEDCWIPTCYRLDTAGMFIPRTASGPTQPGSSEAADAEVSCAHWKGRTRTWTQSRMLATFSVRQGDTKEQRENIT